MMCQAISTAVDSNMSASAHATPSSPKGSGGRGGRGVGCGNTKQVSVLGDCNRCGKAGHYVRDRLERNTYWDLPPAVTKDTATKVHHNK